MGSCVFFLIKARLAQSVERKALNLVVVGSSPTVGVSCYRVCSLRPRRSRWRAAFVASLAGLGLGPEVWTQARRRSLKRGRMPGGDH